MSINSVSYEKLEILEKDIKNKQIELDFYIKNGAKDLWKIDLKELVNKLN
jgi:hypothetical protein